jgi:hypothetical protein
MSTSFQPAEWDYTFFTAFPAATTPLNNLGSQHIRLQPVSEGVPQKADKSWDFSILDAILNPVIGTNDNSPELQLATAPAWMDNSSGNILPADFSDFASYATDVVLYYNTTTGFVDSGGVTHVHSPLTPVTYWGIFNEPNINGLSNSQYVQLYNTTVPAMQAADSSIKFVAVELSDGYNNWEQNYMPTFVNNVTAQVDVLATHFYSSCNQKDTDQQVMATIPGFASGVTYIYSQLATNPALANVPVWITENNVNADFEGSGGMSTCNPGQVFVADARGSSPFFAAWRPLMFSQVGKSWRSGFVSVGFCRRCSIRRTRRHYRQLSPELLGGLLARTFVPVDCRSKALAIQQHRYQRYRDSSGSQHGQQRGSDGGRLCCG